MTREVPGKQVETKPKMVNSVEAYVESGKRAAKAMNDRDMSRYDFENGWFRRAKALESDEGKLLAQESYNEGYTYARVVPAVDRFL